MPAQHTAIRRRLFLAITASLPLLAFGLLEAGLRIAGYGPDLSLFVTEQIGGRPLLLMNPDVKGRYFATVDFSPNTSFDAFPMPKEPGAYRIFCLGGSTTVGYPYGYAGAFSTYLRDRLQLLFPGRLVEVINLGLTATNSYTVLDLARELPAYDPDLLIVYDGHNEFYGALGAASRESAGRSRWITRLYLRLVHARTFLLARDVYARVRSWSTGAGGKAPAGTMMERLAIGQHVPIGSTTYADGLGAFRANLEDLAELCADHGIPVILSTQVSNLRHQPPFVSGGPDSLRADRAYASARTADSTRRLPEARAGYRRARDLDELRFRTSSDFNDALRGMAARPGVIVADIERVFAAASPDSIVGRELILEHLHPNARGYMLMARAYAQTMRVHGLLAGGEEWERRDTVAEDRLAALSPLTELDRRAARRRTEILTAGWPFTAQGSGTPPVPHTDALDAIVERLVRGAINWEQAHVEAAAYHGSTGDTVAMIAEYETLIRQLPRNVSAYLILAGIHARRSDMVRTEALLRRSLGVEETPYARRLLGTIELNRGRPDSAAVHLREGFARSSEPRERLEIGTLLAVSYARSGRKAEAVTTLRNLLAANASYAPARTLLERLERGGE